MVAAGVAGWEARRADGGTHAGDPDGLGCAATAGCPLSPPTATRWLPGQPRWVREAPSDAVRPDATRPRTATGEGRATAQHTSDRRPRLDRETMQRSRPNIGTPPARSRRLRTGERVRGQPREGGGSDDQALPGGPRRLSRTMGRDRRNRVLPEQGQATKRCPAAPAVPPGRWGVTDATRSTPQAATTALPGGPRRPHRTMGRDRRNNDSQRWVRGQALSGGLPARPG